MARQSLSSNISTPTPSTDSTHASIHAVVGDDHSNECTEGAGPVLRPYGFSYPNPVGLSNGLLKTPTRHPNPIQTPPASPASPRKGLLLRSLHPSQFIEHIHNSRGSSHGTSERWNALQSLVVGAQGSPEAMGFEVDDNGNRAHIMLSEEGSSNREGNGKSGSKLGKLPVVTFSEWEDAHAVEDEEDEEDVFVSTPTPSGKASVGPSSSDAKSEGKVMEEGESFIVPDVSVAPVETVEGSGVYVYSKTRVVDPTLKRRSAGYLTNDELKKMLKSFHKSSDGTRSTLLSRLRDFSEKTQSEWYAQIMQERRSHKGPRTNTKRAAKLAELTAAGGQLSTRERLQMRLHTATLPANPHRILLNGSIDTRTKEQIKSMLDLVYKVDQEFPFDPTLELTNIDLRKAEETNKETIRLNKMIELQNEMIATQKQALLIQSQKYTAQITQLQLQLQNMSMQQDPSPSMGVTVPSDLSPVSYPFNDATMPGHPDADGDIAMMDGIYEDTFPDDSTSFDVQQPDVAFGQLPFPLGQNPTWSRDISTGSTEPSLSSSSIIPSREVDAPSRKRKHMELLTTPPEVSQHSVEVNQKPDKLVSFTAKDGMIIEVRRSQAPKYPAGRVHLGSSVAQMLAHWDPTTAEWEPSAFWEQHFSVDIGGQTHIVGAKDFDKIYKHSTAWGPSRKVWMQWRNVSQGYYAMGASAFTAAYGSVNDEGTFGRADKDLREKRAEKSVEEIKMSYGDAFDALFRLRGKRGVLTDDTSIRKRDTLIQEKGKEATLKWLNKK